MLAQQRSAYSGTALSRFRPTQGGVAWGGLYESANRGIVSIPPSIGCLLVTSHNL